MRNTLNNVFATMIVVTITGTLFAQDPVKLSPQMYTVLLDNEHVRVYAFRCKPGEKEPVHSHPAMVTYNLTSSKARSIPKDGDPVEFDLKQGTSDWVEAITHSWECLGPGEQRSIIIEMKGHAKHMAAMSTPDRAADEAAIRAMEAAYEKAVNDGDAAALAALHTPDGDVIAFDGPRVIGRVAIRRRQEELNAERPQTLRFSLEVTGIRFLGPDTAIVESTARFSEGPVRSNRGTLLAVRREGKWLIDALRVYPDESGSAGPDSTADVAAVRSFINRATEINNSGDASAWADMFADGAIVMPEGEPQITGREALEARARSWFDPFNVSITIEPVEIETFGDWAFARTRVTGSLTPKAGGERVSVDLKEIAIYRRRSDGTWKLWRLIGNSNSPR